ncbi:alpha/beta hydrolase [Streptomyces sp. H10-C2]|uniref:alpha/beta hydrolase n=1 Tax=unclassified Streptomyces TaxID=2593676 RepID=UPI0024B8D01A|nr:MULTISPECIES: alpha/beta hydrolase [unclassified Streptomyces]MDJ0340397.1 alpha/beta hydrolase [Streptomyces sp. PH10-H1]MDJ0368155.1 alpha/beta hydrolase [Streptomyces sp. H10-C2]
MPASTPEHAAHRARPPAGPGPADAAAKRAEAEEASLFAHAAVRPDATAAYGELPDQIVDFYRPRAAPGATGRPAPLVVVLHGGAWRAPYDRRHISPFAAHLAGCGFAVASVEYRRGGEEPPSEGDGSAYPREGAPAAGRWPDTFDDIATAVDAVPALAMRALGADSVDPRRVVLTGHSAGGHLALWAAARNALPLDSPWHRTSPPPLRGVVALAPIADFASAIRLRVCSDAVVQFLGGPEHVTARLPHADPAALLPTGIATTIVQGTTDNVVPPQVAQAFAEASALSGEEVTEAVLDGIGHFPLIDPAAGACAVVTEEIAQLAW